MHTKAQDFLQASVSFSHPHSSGSPVSTSSSSPKRSELITVSDGVYSFPLSHQRHSQLTVRVGECRALVRITSLRFLLLSKCGGPPPTSPSGCVSSFHVSLCYILCINILYTRTQAVLDFFIVQPPVCISDLLAGEEKKACDEIFLKSSHYLDSPLWLCCALSDCAQKFLDAACGNWFARRRTHEEETETGRGRGIGGN